MNRNSMVMSNNIYVYKKEKEKTGVFWGYVFFLFHGLQLYGTNHQCWYDPKMITHIDAQLLKRLCFVELFETNKIRKFLFVIKIKQVLKTEIIFICDNNKIVRGEVDIYSIYTYFCFVSLFYNSEEHMLSMWILSENDTTHCRTIAQKAYVS